MTRRPRLRTRFSAGLLLCAAMLGTGRAEPLDYGNQSAWKGVFDHAQSPIDIPTRSAKASDPREPARIVLSRTRAAFEPKDNGHAVEVETHDTDAMIRGRHFTLAQFHFHAESEHTLDGRHFPLEGHFVFKADDGRLAVLGVMYREGKANPQIGAVLDALDDVKKAHQKHLNIDALLPKTRSYYHYLGSLTTPPLTENVEWYVLPTPVTMSQAQIDAFVRHYRRNNRDIQPLNGRALIFHRG